MEKNNIKIKKKEDKAIRYNVYLYKEDKEKLNFISEKTGKKASSIIREMIENQYKIEKEK
jgi:predicted DNA-binding protein